MKFEISLARLEEFNFAVVELFRAFPEFSRETYKCQFDVEREILGRCEIGGDCQMSFEDFHAQRNRIFRIEFGTSSKFGT